MAPSCQPGYHRHQRCERCRRADVTTYAPPTRDGGRFPPLCTDCAVKVMRIRSVERAVGA